MTVFSTPPTHLWLPRAEVWTWALNVLHSVLRKDRKKQRTWTSTLRCDHKCPNLAASPLPWARKGAPTICRVWLPLGGTVAAPCSPILSALPHSAERLDQTYTSILLQACGEMEYKDLFLVEKFEIHAWFFFITHISTDFLKIPSFTLAGSLHWLSIVSCNTVTFYQ